MKRVYEKPMFFAEEYQVASSVAACDIHKGDPDTRAMEFVYGKQYCHIGDGGHTAGAGSIPKDLYPITLFNDGSAEECKFDWKLDNNVYGPDGHNYGVPGKAIYGAKANNDNHIPEYNGQVFYS